AGRHVANANDRPGNVVDYLKYSDSFLTDTAWDVGMETVKSGGGFVVSTLAEAKIQRDLAKGAGGWWPLVATGRWDKAYKAYQEMGGDAFENFSTLHRHLNSGGDSYADLLSKTLKNQDWKLSALKDLGISATLTVAKDIANDQMSQVRFNLYKRLAMLEIDWFIKRNAYNNAMWFREQQKETLRGLMEELGTLYAKKLGNCCAFEQVMIQNKQIATTQAANIRMMSLMLTFTQPMKQDLKVSLEGQSKKASPRINEYNHAIYEMPLYDLLDDPENFSGGDLKLTVFGQSDKNDVLDGDPSTQAVFLMSSGEWKGYDARGVGDKTNTLSFIKPQVTIATSSISPKPITVPVNVSFQSVNSFPDDAAIAIFPAKQKNWHHRYTEFPHTVLQGRVTGSVTIQASLEPGDYEVRLDDGFGDDAAITKLTVANPGFIIKAKLKGENATSTLKVSPNQ
ncbi:MAG: hypothetical protein HOM11_02710, partial [Methylococcales bacterium]|nr:hypothetical protein [Methylococcales bacterium]